MLDEMDRALHDALCIVKRTLESNTVVPGGGAVEAALSVYLEDLATTLGSREQLAIAEFAKSLLIIPKVLAVNAAKDATDLVAKLSAKYNTAQTEADKKHLSRGLDLVRGTVRNNLEAGVIEPAMSKVKILHLDVVDKHLKSLRDVVLQNCRKMSTEEKKALMTVLTQLSPEDLNKALLIVAQSNPNFQATGQEVDLDIDAQSEATLWKLKFFVKDLLQAQGKSPRSIVDGNL